MCLSKSSLYSKTSFCMCSCAPTWFILYELAYWGISNKLQATWCQELSRVLELATLYHLKAGSKISIRYSLTTWNNHLCVVITLILDAHLPHQRISPSRCIRVLTHDGAMIPLHLIGQLQSPTSFDGFFGNTAAACMQCPWKESVHAQGVESAHQNHSGKSQLDGVKSNRPASFWLRIQPPSLINSYHKSAPALLIHVDFTLLRFYSPEKCFVLH